MSDGHGSDATSGGVAGGVPEPAASGAEAPASAGVAAVSSARPTGGAAAVCVGIGGGEGRRASSLGAPHATRRIPAIAPDMRRIATDGVTGGGVLGKTAAL